MGLGSKKSKIDFLAREPHFIHHIAPVWHALPKAHRGQFFSDASLAEVAASRGISIAPTESMEQEGPLTYTASYRDMKHSRNLGRKTVITEHGAGQAYQGAKSQSYLTNTDRAGVVAIFVPAAYQAAIAQPVHPTIPIYEVGLPKFDQLHNDKKPGPRGKVAISFHWDCKVCPETRSALRHYRSAIPQLAKDFDLVGHAHPRFARHLETIYGKYGIPFEPDFEQLIKRAQVYVCDNSSTIYEWASLDRPVVLLNAPWYRLDKEHGLRFWEFADVGVQVGGPRELHAAIRKAITDPKAVANRRREVIEQVYGPCDGGASKRAAGYLIELAERWS